MLAVRYEDVPPPDRELTLKEEIFARVLAAQRSRTMAYREAFNPGPEVPIGTIWGNASTLSMRPYIQARVRQNEILALNNMVIDPRELIQRDIDIAFADPADLVQHLQRSCRHCHGIDHAYHWRDLAEYMAACDATMLENEERAARRTPPPPKPMPSDTGGYGYRRAQLPSPECPECLGAGEIQTVIADTRTLSGKAARLFKGIRVTSSGVEVLMHDQDAAADSLKRMAGLLKDFDLAGEVAKASGKKREAAELPESIDGPDASRTYTALINGG